MVDTAVALEAWVEAWVEVRPAASPAQRQVHAGHARSFRSQTIACSNVPGHLSTKFSTAVILYVSGYFPDNPLLL